MCAKAASKLPYPFDGVEFWTIRRQEQQLQDTPMFSKPRGQEFCVMPAGIVCDNNHLAAFTMSAEKALQESQECSSVECLGPLGNQGSISNTHRPQYTDLFSGGRMQHYGIFHLRGNPHSTPRPVLLKVAFVLKPQINVISFG